MTTQLTIAEKVVSRIDKAFRLSTDEQLAKSHRTWTSALYAFEQLVRAKHLWNGASVSLTLNLAYYLHNYLYDYKRAMEIYLYYVAQTDPQKSNDRDAPVFNNIALVLIDIGDFAAAKCYLLKALKIYNRISGKRSEDSLWILSNIAHYYSNVGNNRRAIRIAHAVISAWEQLDVVPHRYNKVLNNLAVDYRELGQYESAKHYFSLALQKQLSAHEGKPHPDVAMAYAHLADMEAELNHFAAAKPLFEKAVAMFEQLYPQGDPLYASTLTTWATFHEHLGHIETAFQLNGEALEMLQKLGLEKSYEATNAANNVGMIYRLMQDLEQAIHHVGEALATRCEILGEEHIACASLYMNLAVIQHDADLLSDALQNYQKAFVIFCNHYGDQHLDLGILLSNMAGIYAQMEDYEQALELRREGFRVIYQIKGLYSSDTAFALNNVALGYLDLQKLRSALKLFSYQEKLLQQLEPQNSQNHFPSLYNNIAMTWQAKQQYHNAEMYFKKALDAIQQLYGTQHSEYASVLVNQAINNSLMGNIKTCLKRLEEALNIQCAILGEEHQDVVYTRELIEQIGKV